MKVGILKEIKNEEYRVAMTPAGVDQMVRHGHTVFVETGAGTGSDFSDEVYLSVGAEVLPTPMEIYGRSEMVMHVKEVMPSEYGLLREGQILFSYLHLAAEPTLTKALMASRCVAIAYETVQAEDGRLPLLQPMSEIAGRMSVQQGAKYLEIPYGGRGVLLGGVPGVAPARVLILGGGIVGANAARMACGLGADVVLLDSNLDRLRHLSEILAPNCKLLFSNPFVVREQLHQSDLVIGAVLLPGARAPHLVTREMLAGMKRGAVMIDVSIDQGGCFETSHPTTHSDPVFMVDGILHYCVANMPGAVALTSTLALTNATLPYALALANKGWERALAEDKALRRGLNICRGEITHSTVAEAFASSVAAKVG